MRFRFLTVAMLAVFSLWPHYHGAAAEPAPESDQQINEFSLAGYGERGKKTWDLSAHSADIFDNLVKLKGITGNLYGPEENISLSAKKGDFDKVKSLVRLKDDVVITSSGGAKLTTESLDWDRKNHIVSTDEFVRIQRDSMVTTGRGARGNTDLKRVDLARDVKVEITPQVKGSPAGGDPSEKIVITCDGALEIDYQKNVAVFNKNVKVLRQDLEIDSDRMEVYFLPNAKGAKDTQTPRKKPASANISPAAMTTSIDKIVARDNVRIVRGRNISYSEEAVYNGADKKITLLGQPKLIIYTGEGLNAFAGN